MTVGVGFDGNQNLALLPDRMANSFYVVADIRQVDLRVSLVKHALLYQEDIPLIMIFRT